MFIDGGQGLPYQIEYIIEIQARSAFTSILHQAAKTVLYRPGRGKMKEEKDVGLLKRILRVVSVMFPEYGNLEIRNQTLLSVPAQLLMLEWQERLMVTYFV